MTPRHGKPRVGRQEILVLHPKSFPKQRNGLPGQIAEILTAKFKKKKKKSTWRNSPQKQRGLGRDPRADSGGFAWAFCPLARWWLGKGWDFRRFPAKTTASLPHGGVFGAEREEQSPSGGRLQLQQRQLLQGLPAFRRKPCWWLLFRSAESDSFPSPCSPRWIELWQGWAQSLRPQWWLYVLPGAGVVDLLIQVSCPVSKLSLKASRMDLKVFLPP